MNSNTFQDNPATTGDGEIVQVRLARPLRRPMSASGPSSTTSSASSSVSSSDRRRSRCGSPTGSTIPARPTSAVSSSGSPTACRDPRGAARRLEDVHRAQAVRAGVLLLGQRRLGLVAAARPACGRAGALSRRPRPPPAEHEHRAGRQPPGDGRPSRRLPLQRLEVRRRRPHRRLDPPVPVLPHRRRAVQARRRADARRRLHDRRLAQPQGPARGHDPGHRSDPGHGRPGALVDYAGLEAAQDDNDPAIAAEVLQRAYRSDVRPIVAEARRRNGAAIDPLLALRRLGYRRAMVDERGRRRWRPACERAVPPRLRPSTSGRRRSGCAGSTSTRCAPNWRSSTGTPITRSPMAMGRCGGTGTGSSPRWSVVSITLVPGVRWRRSASTRGASTTACSTPRRPRRPPSRTATSAPPATGTWSTASASGGSTRSTGLQLMPINTIFQLAAHDRDALSQARTSLLMLPELLAYHLTGEVTAELTSAGTTGLLDLATGDWSAELLDAIDVASNVCPRSSARARWSEVARRPGAPRRRPRHRVGGARRRRRRGGLRVGGDVAARRPDARPPDTSEAARLERFTNEQGAAGGIRLLRNVAGWWLVEECRRRGGIPISTRCSPLRRSSVRCPPPTPPTTGSSLPPTWPPSWSPQPGSADGDACRDHPLRRRVDGPVDGRGASPSSVCRASRCSAAGRGRRCCCSSSPSTSMARSRSARWRRRRSATRCPRVSPSACSARSPRARRVRASQLATRTGR